MKKNKQSAILAWITSIFKMEEIPTTPEGKADLNEDQRKLIEQQIGVEKAQRLYDKLDQELSAAQNEAEENSALQAVLDELDITVEGEASDNPEAKQLLITERITKMQEDLAKQREEIAKMAKTSLGDKPLATFQNDVNEYAKNLVVKHSATHLFGSNSIYNAFDNRSWNVRKKTSSLKATVFGSEEIPVLEGDLQHFIRENPKAIDSLLMDFNQLPTEWSFRSGIVDTVADAGVDVGEIVQARSESWQPKNKFVISAEIGKVFPKKIDIEFDGVKLQELENTWVRSVINLNGSHPWKDSFIGFLLSEFVKQAAVDDRIAQIKGTYVPTPEGKPGLAINSQDGLLYILHKARDIDFKYRPFSIGVPTATNTYDWIKNMVEMLPEDIRNMQGLEIVCDPKIVRWYNEDAALRYRHKYDTDQGSFAYKKNHVVDYPNIIFQPLVDMAGSNFVFITFSKNIEVLEYDPSEKGKFSSGRDRRNSWFFADYRLGIRLKRIGLKLAKDHQDKYRAQLVWSNDAPIFPENYKVPAYDNKSGILTVKGDHVLIGDDFTNDITSIEGVAEGRIIKITGNNNLSSSSVKIVDGGTLDLVSNFNLKTEGTLVLYAKAGGGFKEISRTTTGPTSTEGQVVYTTATIDATEGSVFKFTGSAALSLTNVLNGIEQKKITIYGGAGGVVTVANTGNIVPNGSLSLADGTKYVELIYTAGKWYETTRG